jgi:GxxExxY protein
MYDENQIAKQAVHICFHLHKKFGPGLFESVYEELLAYELQKA